MNELPWSERVNMLSINPEAATVEDIARLSAEHLSYRTELERLKDVVSEEDVIIITGVLKD